jgi:hypothetical protein
MSTYFIVVTVTYTVLQITYTDELDSASIGKFVT